MPEETVQSLNARQIITGEIEATTEINATDAEIVMINTTGGDGSQDRKSTIRGRGTQSGGETSTLGFIQFRHEGSADDEKGQIAFFLNSGAQAEAPSQKVSIYNNLMQVAVQLDLTDNNAIRMGSGTDTSIVYSSVMEHMLIGVDTTRNMLVLTSVSNVANNHDHGNQTNPTLFIHSDTDPDSNNTQWISITHDQTDGVIDCGLGTLNLGATGNVNFAGATATGTGDTATNGYVTMEVAGAAIKFATVA